MAVFRTLVSDESENFNPNRWDQVAGTSLTGSDRWQKYWRHSLVRAFPPSQTTRIAVFQDGRMAGHCGAFRYPFPPPLPHSWQRKLARSLLWPINPINFHGPFQYAPGCDRAETGRRLLDGITDLQRRWLAPAARFVMLDECRDREFLSLLEEGGYQITPGITDTRLAIRWTDFDSYLQEAVKGRHRKQLIRYQKEAQAAGIRFEVTGNARQYADQITGLIQNVAHRNRCEPLLSDRFPQMAAKFLAPGDMVMVLAWQEEELLACTMNYRDGTRLTMKSLGMDYERGGPLNLYRLIILEGIRHAIETGAGEVRCGCSQFEIKQRLGFSQVPTLSAVKAWPPVLNRLFSYRLKSMRGQENAVDNPVQTLEIGKEKI